MGNQYSKLQGRIKALIKEKKDLEEQLKEALKTLRELKRDEFNKTIEKARQVVQICQNRTKKVVVLLGAPGAGKTTISQYLLEIKEADPQESASHGTREFIFGHSAVLDADVVDTVGRVPDAKGIMRVLACVYNQGWDPVAIVAVYTGRPGHFEVLTSHLQASSINLIDFSPKPFYKAMKKGLDVDDALDMAIGGENVDLFSHVNMISMPKDAEGRIPYEECRVTDNLLASLETLTYDYLQASGESEGIANSLAYYMAKCVAERAAYSGKDLDFIERP